MLLELIDNLPFARGRLTSVVRQATDVHTQSHSALAVKQILVLICVPQTIAIDGRHDPVLEVRLLAPQVQARTHEATHVSEPGFRHPDFRKCSIPQ
jgi:hypothetical protein